MLAYALSASLAIEIGEGGGGGSPTAGRFVQRGLCGSRLCSHRQIFRKE